MKGKGSVRPKRAKLRRPDYQSKSGHGAPSSLTLPAARTGRPGDPEALRRPASGSAGTGTSETDPSELYPEGVDKLYYKTEWDEADKISTSLEKPLPDEPGLRARMHREYVQQVADMGAVMTPTLVSIVQVLVEDRTTLLKAHRAVREAGAFRRNRKTGGVRQQGLYRELILPLGNSIRLSTRLFLDEIAKQQAANGTGARADHRLQTRTWKR